MTAQDEHAFLTAVLAAPDDDTPRLVFADWLDERAQGDDTARAALIRAQCRMEHLGPGTKEYRELAARAKAVLKEHEPQWTKVLRESGLVRRWTFRRGFLDGVEMSATTFAHNAERLFEIAPTIRTARFPDASNEVGPLARCASLSRLSTVDLHSMCSCGLCPIHNDLRALFASKHTRGLTRLNLANNRLDAAGVKRLVASKGLSQLVELDLSENWIMADGLEELAKAKHLTRLVTLDLSDSGVYADQASGFAKLTNLPALRHLRLRHNTLDAACVRALVAAPLFAQLTSLDLSHNRLGAAGARALAGILEPSKLEVLDVRKCELIEPAMRTLKQRFGKRVKV